MTLRKTEEAKIDIAHPHTIKKFELIEEYVKAWAQKLLNYQQCNGIVFIDCMCNSGLYRDDDGNEVIGTPIRVANYLSEIMKKYPNKQCIIYFNDLDSAKIDLLKTKLPQDAGNFHIYTSCGDGNGLISTLGSQLSPRSKMNYLLVYDPYTASVDWDALLPFLRNWGEVIINHMVSDSIRGVAQAKRDFVVEKYEQTYLAKIGELVALGSDRAAYEGRIKEIITALRGTSPQKYYIASFPFFNSKNALVYSLIHCSGNINGFRLYKKTAWNIFDGKSSAKKTYGIENQLMLGFDGTGGVTTHTDEYCYNVSDIAKYLQSIYKGQKDVTKDSLWEALDEHPVFPSEGFRREITNALRDEQSANLSKQSVSFRD